MNLPPSAPVRNQEEKKEKEESSSVPSLGFLYARLRAAERIAVRRALEERGIRISEEVADAVVAAIDNAITDAGRAGWSQRPLPPAPEPAPSDFAAATAALQQAKTGQGSEVEGEIRPPAPVRKKSATTNAPQSGKITDREGKEKNRRRPRQNSRPRTDGFQGRP